jgi:DNA-binding MarR family transcriptional regulator
MTKPTTNELSHLAREIRKRRPFENPEEETVLNLLRTAWAVNAAAERLFRRSGLSGGTYNVLRILRGELAGGTRGVSCGDIGERLVVQVPDVTRLVDRLEKNGLVRRQRGSDDKRVVMIEITPRGLELMAEIDSPLQALHRSQLGHLSKGEQAELNRLLVKARERVEGGGEGG